MSESKGFSQRLKELRKQARLSQSNFADLVGVSFMTIRRWESGEVIPRMNEIKQICEVLQVSESELLNGPRDGKVELIVSWNWEDMKKGEINMNEDKFKLILGEDGMIGLHGAGQITSHEAIEEFLSKVREQLEVALEAQIRRGAIPEA